MSLTPFVPTETELKSYQIIATIAANNPHWKKLGGNGSDESIIATILSVMLLARELGISPIQSVSGGINNIQGKFEISARIMNQLIRKHGHKLEIRLLNDEVCKIWGKRRDTGEEMEVTYHIEEARRSGLVRDGGPWKKTPQDMLFARCISRLARRLTPDCIGGCYIEGELQESILKQSPESIELPKREEFEIIEPDIKIDLPEDIQKEQVEEFINETAEQTRRSVRDIKKRATENMQGFLDKFKQWKDKKYPMHEDAFEQNAV
jgi:hypothetical protein